MINSKKQIQVGVVGCGYWGPNLIRNFRQLGDCHLKSLCDTSETRLAHMRRLYPEVAMVRDFSDILNDPELDALAIATPVRFHFDMAKAALAAGKHVFIEKPMSRTRAEGE
ncbi:MAG: Gfo/Idh/MocA family protein [Limisphaerales bacterium]